MSRAAATPRPACARAGRRRAVRPAVDNGLYRPGGQPADPGCGRRDRAADHGGEFEAALEKIKPMTLRSSPMPA